MSPEAPEPTFQEIKAMASSPRLWILRLCKDREWTNKELAESGCESISDVTRFHLHFEDAARESFLERFKSLIEEFRADDAARDRAPGYRGIFVLHRLATENRDDP